MSRLLVVPFTIVAKAREIAERKRKTGANERRERGERRAEKKKASSLFSCFSPCSSLAALCAIKKGTASSLVFEVFGPQYDAGREQSESVGKFSSSRGFSLVSFIAYTLSLFMKIHLIRISRLKILKRI